MGIRGKFPNLVNGEEIGVPHILNEIKKGKQKEIKNFKNVKGEIKTSKSEKKNKLYPNFIQNFID